MPRELRVGVLTVGKYEAAMFIRRLLQHSGFNAESKRLGCVILIGHAGIRFWRLHAEKEETVGWE